jgi:hypothetical protein
MPIKDYSTTAANNTLTPPNGAPEGMAAGLVNNTIRQVMADTRLFYESGGWCDLGHVPTYVSATSFTIPTDVTAFYTVGRRIRMYGAIMGTLYGFITASAYSAPNTTVTVVLDSGSLTSNLSSVLLAFTEQEAQRLADNAVTTAKIANNSVTFSKLSAGAPFWDVNSNVGIGTGAPTVRLDVQGGTSRFGPVNTTTDYQGIIIQNGKDSSLSETNCYVESRNNLGTPDSGISFFHGTNGGAGAFIWATLTGSRTTDRRYIGWMIEADGKQTSVVSGFSTGTRYPQFGCRAWVNFQGTGTVTIRDARNVSSVADTGTGDYQINFSQAMPTNQYAAIGTSGADNRLTTYAATVFIEEQQTGAVMIYTGTHGNSSPPTYVDMQIINVAIFL